MRKHRKQCSKCKNFRKNLMRCLASKSNHNFNFFGVSKVNCLNYGDMGYNFPELGYKPTEHFEEQAGKRNIAREKIERVLVYGEKSRDEKNRFKFKLGRLFVITDGKFKTLITCYRKENCGSGKY